MKIYPLLRNTSLSFFLFGLLLTSCNDSSNETNGDDTEISTDSLSSDANTTTAVNTTGVVENQKAEDLVNTKDASKLNPAQLSVQKLLSSCVNSQYAEAAKVIMYRGKDESRMGLDHFNYQNANEANTVKVTCDVITNWLGASQSYEFISYQEEETEYGLQYIVEIMFKKEKLGVERHFFYLMETPKGMMLINMI